MAGKVSSNDGRTKASQQANSAQKKAGGGNLATDDKYASQERALRLAGEHMNKIDELIAQN